jgi:2-polyprenyl-6-methoxyphenol hydroxylase-like FAD-dependent oxidoreductase
MTQRSGRNAVVVGAGPVGCLAAISLAKSGWNVQIYEGRPGKCCNQLYAIVLNQTCVFRYEVAFIEGRRAAIH